MKKKTSLIRRKKNRDILRYEFRIAILYKSFVYCDISIYRDTPTVYTSIQISIGLQTGNLPSCCGILSIGGFRGGGGCTTPLPLWSDFTEKGSFLAIFWLRPPLSGPKLMVHKSNHERLRNPPPPPFKNVYIRPWYPSTFTR